MEAVHLSDSNPFLNIFCRQKFTQLRFQIKFVHTRKLQIGKRPSFDDGHVIEILHVKDSPNVDI